MTAPVCKDFKLLLQSLHSLLQELLLLLIDTWEGERATACRLVLATSFCLVDSLVHSLRCDTR